MYHITLLHGKGAGKTETAKLIIKYLVERSALNLHAKNDSSKLKSGSATVAAALLQSSPVLEAFGNSKSNIINIIT